MLHILLLLLKIIGFILLFLLLIILLVLITPIRYQFEVRKEDESPPYLKVQVTWFIRAVSVTVSYIDQVLSYGAKVLGIQIAGNQPEYLARKEEKQKKKEARRKKKEEEQTEEARREKKEEEQTEEARREKIEEGQTEKAGSTDNSDTPGQMEQETPELSAVSVENVEEQEKPLPGTSSPKEENSEKKDDIPEPGKNQKKADQEQKRIDREQRKAEKAKKKEEKKAAKAKVNEQKRAAKKKKKEEKKSAEGEKASESGKLTQLLDKVKEVKSTYDEYHGEALIRKAFTLLGKVLKHVRPRRLTGYLKFGMDDPAVTGYITGALAVFYPVYRSNFTVEPVFYEKCLSVNCRGSGRIRPIYFIYLGIWLILDKNVRRLIKLVICR
ncbi:MAG: DUF2953 domain-containing protein [Eubacterium sp.]|nr:DUF2953 domain-containing protein [Eubacterium sp.]